MKRVLLFLIMLVASVGVCFSAEYSSLVLPYNYIKKEEKSVLYSNNLEEMFANNLIKNLETVKKFVSPTTATVRTALGSNPQLNSIMDYNEKVNTLAKIYGVGKVLIITVRYNINSLRETQEGSRVLERTGLITDSTTLRLVTKLRLVDLVENKTVWDNVYCKNLNFENISNKDFSVVQNYYEKLALSVAEELKVQSGIKPVEYKKPVEKVEKVDKVERVETVEKTVLPKQETLEIHQPVPVTPVRYTTKIKPQLQVQENVTDKKVVPVSKKQIKKKVEVKKPVEKKQVVKKEVVKPAVKTETVKPVVEKKTIEKPVAQPKIKEEKQIQPKVKEVKPTEPVKVEKPKVEKAEKVIKPEKVEKIEKIKPVPAQKIVVPQEKVKQEINKVKDEPIEKIQKVEPVPQETPKPFVPIKVDKPVVEKVEQVKEIKEIKEIKEVPTKVEKVKEEKIEKVKEAKQKIEKVEKLDKSEKIEKQQGDNIFKRIKNCFSFELTSPTPKEELKPEDIKTNQVEVQPTYTNIHVKPRKNSRNYVPQFDNSINDI